MSTINWWWLAYPALGAFAGFFAGLLGVGGGAIMVPILTTVFLAQAMPASVVLHLALGTSMATIVFTSIASFRAHHDHGVILWPIFWQIVPGILIGTFCATFVASQLSTQWLALFFGAFIGYVALQMMLNIKPKPSRELPGKLGTTSVGILIGGVSALAGIGGGALSVPFMTWCNVKVHNAIGTSAAIGLPIALSGTLGYLINGWHANDLPAMSLGYVYMPGMVLMTTLSMITAPLGAKLAHRLPVATLKRIFAGVLVLLCAKMLSSVL
jgi:uncharacterized membrane protein YfcA